MVLADQKRIYDTSYPDH